MLVEGRRRAAYLGGESAFAAPRRGPFEEAGGLREGEFGYRLHARCQPSARLVLGSAIPGVALLLGCSAARLPKRRARGLPLISECSSPTTTATGHTERLTSHRLTRANRP